MRGSLRRVLHARPEPGSIPACAGEPCARSRSGARSGVHPRVCGGAQARDLAIKAGEGPSPRVRGSRGNHRLRRTENGSIPACAGEPDEFGCRGSLWPVHPRVCGGAQVRGGTIIQLPGPSPRVRGSPFPCALETVDLGSIPACAGEPIFRHVRPSFTRVHPRVCGGAGLALPATGPALGPSPRVRGSRNYLTLKQN